MTPNDRLSLPVCKATVDDQGKDPDHKSEFMQAGGLCAYLPGKIVIDTWDPLVSITISQGLRPSRYVDVVPPGITVLPHLNTAHRVDHFCGLAGQSTDEVGEGPYESEGP